MAAPKPLTRIINRGNGHSYLLDGEKCPGVTTIIKEGFPAPGLIYWSGDAVSEYVIERLQPKDGHVFADDLVSDLRTLNDQRKKPERLGDFSRLGLTKVLSGVPNSKRDTAGALGTKVHGLAEQLARGEEIEVADEVKGHVESYVRFLDEFHPSNALLERVVVSRSRRYMGKLDMIADFPGYGRGLVDIKTKRSAPYGDTALQLAGYRYAETLITEDGAGEEPMPEVDWCGVVWVRADGYDVIPFTVDVAAFRIFLYVKEVAGWRDRDDGGITTVIQPALRPPVLETSS